MSWPALSDYQEAVQTPGVSFLDPDLCQATPDPDTLGLPRAMSGNFAVVFPVHNGTRTWAVRCFSTFHADQESRYRAISQHLQAHSLGWMVDFRYLPQGVRVRGNWYPILKMEWVEGELLNRYVARHLTRPEKLFGLIQQFVRLVDDLEEQGIAHGDLQHANLIVADDRLRLIDYDGMYVPSLQGLASHELGHINYQHPRRSHRDFGPYVDNFSAWVIYLSLLALSIDPKLWVLADSGDEHLLFRKQDFERPQQSLTLHALRTSPTSSLNGIASYLTTLIRYDVAQVPRLRPDALQLVATTAARAGAPIPDWLDDAPTASAPQGIPVLRPRRGHSRPPSGQVSEGPLPDWLGDQPAAGQAVGAAEESARRPASRVIFGLWLLTLPVLLGLAVGGMVAPVAAAGLLLLGFVALQATVAGSYVLSQPFRRKAVLLARIWWLRQERKRLKGALNRLIARERKLEARRREALARALQAHQNRFVQTELARNPLFLAPIPGIGLILRARLYAAGYRTAADIEPRVIRIRGVGPSRAVALLEWRRRCEARIARQMPRSLPPAEAAAINRRWNRRLRWVRQSLSQSTQAYHAHGQALAAAERDVQPYLQTSLRGYLGQVFSL